MQLQNSDNISPRPKKCCCFVRKHTFLDALVPKSALPTIITMFSVQTFRLWDGSLYFFYCTGCKHLFGVDCFVCLASTGNGVLRLWTYSTLQFEPTEMFHERVKYQKSANALFVLRSISSSLPW